MYRILLLFLIPLLLPLHLLVPLLLLIPLLLPSLIPLLLIPLLPLLPLLLPLTDEYNVSLPDISSPITDDSSTSSTPTQTVSDR